VSNDETGTVQKRSPETETTEKYPSVLCLSQNDGGFTTKIPIITFVIPNRKIQILSVRAEPLKKVMTGFKHTGKSFIYRTDNQQTVQSSSTTKTTLCRYPAAGAEPHPDHFFPYDPLTYLGGEYSPDQGIFTRQGEVQRF
jgi:hypothetical protein